ncbi:MAG: class I SAM-dependent methyltransferase [bacterium]
MEMECFWNDVFANDRSEWVAPHPPSYFLEYLSRVGDGFPERLQAAEAVLDVGPGRARLLHSLPPTVAKFAIEVSEVNRRALHAAGIRTDLPSRGIDLAWSVSCFPHCPDATKARLLQDTARALRPGGHFYLECVEQRPGFSDDVPEGIRLPAGRFVVPLDRMLDEGRAHGLVPVAHVGAIQYGDDCPVQGYIICFTKPVGS